MDKTEAANSAIDRPDRPRHPPQDTTIEPASNSKKKRSGVRRKSQRGIQASRKVSASKPPEQPTMSHKRDHKGGQDQQRYNQSERTSKDHIGKKVEWGKQYAINTKRKQDYLDREAEKAAKSTEFLGLPPEGTHLIEASYFWSDENLDIHSLLGEDLCLLNSLRTTYKVYIDFIESLSCIRLWSKTPENVKSAMAGIKAKIQHAREDFASRAPMYIVDPPSVDAMRSDVSPTFQASQRNEAPSIVINVNLSGLLLTAQQRAAWEVERKAIMEHVHNRFSTHMANGLAELCALNKAMRMRVNLGKIHIHRYRKELRQGCFPFQKFLKMMEEFCTLGKFDGVIHGTSAAGEILDMFNSASSVFEPTDSFTSSLADIKAKHSLLIIAHGASEQSVRIEADIDIVQPGIRGNNQNDAGWQIGAMRYFPNGLDFHKTRLAVGFLSVEHNFDACLEITAEDVVLQPPKAFRSLVEHCIRGTLTFTTEKSSLTYPAVKLIAPHGISVEKCSVTSALHYKLRGTSYVTEVALCHEWDSGNVKRAPLTSCSVSFYHRDWDIFMNAEESIECPKVVDMQSLFPTEPNTDDGVAAFLAHIQTLTQFVSHVKDVC